MSSKRKHNHNATAEIECLKNKTNSFTDKVFQCLFTQFLSFFFYLSSPIFFDNIAMLALYCSLLRFKSFPLITYDRPDLSLAKCMHLNALSSIMAIAFSNCFTYVLSIFSQIQDGAGIPDVNF